MYSAKIRSNVIIKIVFQQWREAGSEGETPSLPVGNLKWKSRVTLAGFPTTIVFGSTSFVSTAPPATTAFITQSYSDLLSEKFHKTRQTFHYSSKSKKEGTSRGVGAWIWEKFDGIMSVEQSNYGYIIVCFATLLLPIYPFSKRIQSGKPIRHHEVRQYGLRHVFPYAKIIFGIL